MAGLKTDGHLPFGQDKKAQRPGRLRGPGRGGESAVLDEPAQPAAVPGGAPARWGVIDCCGKNALPEPPCGATAGDKRRTVRPRGAIGRLDIGARLRVGVGGWMGGWVDGCEGPERLSGWGGTDGLDLPC